MKKITQLLLLLLPFLAAGQTKKYELGISAGNIGLTDQVFEDFYKKYTEFYYHSNVEINSIEIKYTLSARYFITENISARLKFGSAIIKDELHHLTESFQETIEADQKIVDISTSLCYSKTFDKFEISTGFEIPYFMITEFNSKSKRTASDPANENLNFEDSRSLPGGQVWGLTSFIGVKYFFNKSFGIGSEISYGLLHADIDGHAYVNLISYYSETHIKNYVDYNKTYFSSPEFSFGIYVKLGNKKPAETPSK